jgi:hypothetical protein
MNAAPPLGFLCSSIANAIARSGWRTKYFFGEATPVGS